MFGSRNNHTATTTTRGLADNSLAGAREHVLHAEAAERDADRALAQARAAEREADRMLAQARTAVREAKEHARRVEKAAAEE